MHVLNVAMVKACQKDGSERLGRDADASFTRIKT
jgi:hypothetical protein